MSLRVDADADGLGDRVLETTGASSPLTEEAKFKNRKNTKATTGNNILQQNLLDLGGVSREEGLRSSPSVFTLLPNTRALLLSAISIPGP